MNPTDYSDAPRQSALALASVLCAMLGPFCCCLAFPAALGAIVCGHLALLEISKANGTLRGRELAWIGLLAGYAELAFFLLVGIAWLVLNALGLALKA